MSPGSVLWREVREKGSAFDTTAPLGEVGSDVANVSAVALETTLVLIPEWEWPDKVTGIFAEGP